MTSSILRLLSAIANALTSPSLTSAPSKPASYCEAALTKDHPVPTLALASLGNLESVENIVQC